MAERSGDLWASFQHDPRDPAVAPLRASDADRNIVHGLLTEAFADGRLDREEYDERTASVLRARTLGEFPPLVADLVPDRPLLPSSASRVPLAAASSTDIQKRAEAKWREDRRGAFFSFLGPTIITWAIWFAVNLENGINLEHDFPWPFIVMVVTFLNFLRVATNRSEMVESEVRRLERKRAKEIEARKKKRIDP